MKLDKLFPDEIRPRTSPAANKGSSKTRHTFISELIAGQEIDDVWLVLEASLRAAKNGSKYVNATFGDRSGTIPVRQWDASENDFAVYAKGAYIRVRGRVETYRERPQMIVFQVQKADPRQISPADFLPVSTREPEEMSAELDTLIASVGDPDYRRLLEAVFNDEKIRPAFLENPAAAAVHHAWRGGLIEHVLSVARSVDALAKDRPFLNRDLLLSGVLLHDLGKIEEIDAGPGFQYTDAGRLCGHIALGVLMVERRISTLEDFPAKKRNLILHMILSHHGTREFGSPVTPATPEAIVLHHLECLDAKCQGFQSAIERVRETGRDDGWTDFVRVADGRIYMG